MAIHTGGCHCGRVRFRIEAPEELEVTDCNCSMCARLGGFHHVIVAREKFTLLQGEEHLSRYTFHTGVAQHLFCQVCGIKSFYVPRSHPDAYSVSAFCLDPSTVKGMRVRAFDGAHWEAHVAELPPAK